MEIRHSCITTAMEGSYARRFRAAAVLALTACFALALVGSASAVSGPAGGVTAAAAQYPVTPPAGQGPNLAGTPPTTSSPSTSTPTVAAPTSPGGTSPTTATGTPATPSTSTPTPSLPAPGDVKATSTG